MKKSLLSMLMILCIVASIILTIPITVSAVTGADIVAKAEDWLDYPYGWADDGGVKLDCSGLVQRVYAACGYSIPRLTYDQALIGTKVAISDLQPGDICCFSYPNKEIEHVGIYVGNDRMIHAPGDGELVRYGNYISTWTYYNGADCKLEYGRRLVDGISNPTEAPSNAVLVNKGDNGKYVLGENVTFSFNIKDNVQLHLYIYSGKDVYFEGEFNSRQTYTRQFYQTGHYSAYAVLYYSSGNVETGWIGWDIVNKPNVVIDKGNDGIYGIGEPVNFSCDASYSGTYHLYIYKGTEKYFEGEFNMNAQYERVFYQTGHYSCYIVTHTTGGNIETGRVGWDINPVHIVTFETGQDDIFVNDKQVTYKLPYGELPTLRKDGYLFKGWYMAPNNDMQITNSTVVTENSPHTLYAQWQKLFPYIEASVKKSDSAYSVEVVPYNIEYSNDIIVASYVDGRLVTFERREYLKDILTFTVTGNIDEIKVMVWDKDTLKPLCDVEVIPESEFIVE